jgi:hypothetical protein
MLLTDIMIIINISATINSSAFSGVVQPKYWITLLPLQWMAIFDQGWSRLVDG